MILFCFNSKKINLINLLHSISVRYSLSQTTSRSDTRLVNNCNATIIFVQTSGGNPVLALHSVDWHVFVGPVSAASVAPIDFFAVTLYPTVTTIAANDN